MKNREIQKLVATGTPVKFQQTPEEGKEDVHGNALTAEYYPETQLLILIEEAVVWQGKNSTASERIEYDRAVSPPNASTLGLKTRLTPNNNPGNNHLLIFMPTFYICQ
jgi:lipopolysaccharide export system protein LptA